MSEEAYEEHMNPGDMGDAPGGQGGDNYEEFGPVISDVPVHLSVELGRVECRMRDVAYMRVGQVIELKRSPHQPMDLVINNQIVGRGELVEVDGQLAIRIIDLAR
jgi:flagellar motor switch protein FliN